MALWAKAAVGNPLLAEFCSSCTLKRKEKRSTTAARFDVVMTKSHMTHYLKVNGEKFPFNDVRMRQAVSYAIDRETINEQLWGGLCTPAYGILSYRTPFYKDIQGEYNMEKAKELADEVLQGQRVAVDMIVSESRAASYPYKAEAEYLQSELAKIGLDVNIKILDGTLYNEARNNGEYNCTLDAHGFNNADPYSNLFGYIGTEGGSNVKYHFGYSNAEVDALLAEVKVTADEQKRKEIYDQIQVIAAEELPMIPILYDVNVNVHNKAITGYKTVPAAWQGLRPPVRVAAASAFNGSGPTIILHICSRYMI